MDNYTFKSFKIFLLDLVINLINYHLLIYKY